MDISRIAKKYQQPEENILMDIGTYASQLTNIYDLSLGDPDITTPSSIIQQAAQDSLDGWTHYTASNGCQEFLDSVVNFYKKEYNISFQSNQVRATVGVLQGMMLALQVILDPDDEVIIFSPYFSPYTQQVQLAGGIPVIIPTYEEDQFIPNLNILEKKITSKTKAIIINTPTNPTGAVYNDDILQGIAKIAKQYNLFILSDEIYEFFNFKYKHTPICVYAPENTFTFSGFSKTFAMTGWRIGYMIAPSYVNQVAKQINENVTYSAPTMSQRGGIYALNHSQELIPDMVALFEERLTYIKKRVDDNPLLSMLPVQGSIYAFVNIKATKLSSLEFSEQLLKQEKVLVIPGKAFGNAGEGFVRIAATQPVNILKLAFNQIDRFTETIV